MKVSILVPIYNVENHFGACLDSIFSQTYEDIEYVFVNDCTPDGSMAVLEEKIKQYPHHTNSVKVIENSTNQGIAKVRNTLLDNAGGDYILFVDSDDWIESDMVSLLAREAISKNADIIGCDYFEDCNDNSTIVRQVYPEDHEELMKSITLLNIKGVLWKLLIRRSIITDNNLRFANDIDFGEDYIFCCKLFFFSHTIASVRKSLYHYIQYNANNYCSLDIDKRINSFAQAIAEVETFYKQHGVHALLEKELNIRKFLNKSQYILNNDKRDIRKWSGISPEVNGLWRELNYGFGNRIKFFIAEGIARLFCLK